MKRSRGSPLQQQSEKPVERKEPTKFQLKCPTDQKIPKTPVLPIRNPVSRCHRTSGQWVVSESDQKWQACNIGTLEKSLYRYAPLPVQKTLLLYNQGYDHNEDEEGMPSLGQMYRNTFPKQRLSKRSTRQIIKNKNAIVYSGLFCPLYLQIDPRSSLENIRENIKEEMDRVLLLAEKLANGAEIPGILRQKVTKEQWDHLFSELPRSKDRKALVVQTSGLSLSEEERRTLVEFLEQTFHFRYLVDQVLPEKDLFSSKDISLFIQCGGSILPLTGPLRQFETSCHTSYRLPRGDLSSPNGWWPQGWSPNFAVDNLEQKKMEKLREYLAYSKQELLQQIQQEVPEQDLQRQFGFHYRDLSKPGNFPPEVLADLVKHFIDWSVNNQMQVDHREVEDLKWELYVVLPEYFYTTTDVFYTAIRDLSKQKKYPETQVILPHGQRSIPAQQQQRQNRTYRFHNQFLVTFLKKMDPFDPYYLFALQYPGEKFTEHRFRQFVQDPEKKRETIRLMDRGHLQLNPKFKLLPRQKVIIKPYQAFVAEYILRNPGLLCYHDAGTGKTLTAVASVLSYLTNDPKHIVFIVCPAAVVLQWEREIQYFIVPTPGDHSLERGYEKAQHLQGCIHVLSYNKLSNLMQKIMSEQRMSPEDGDYPLFHALHTYKGNVLFVFDEIHDVSSKFLKSTERPPSWFSETFPRTVPKDKKDSKSLKLPTGSYWVRAACVLFGKRVLYLSATPFINELKDFQFFFFNLMILQQPLSKRDVQKLLLWKKLGDPVSNASLKEDDFYFPALPNQFLPNGPEGTVCQTLLTRSIEQLFRGPEEEFRNELPNLLSFFSNFRGMIHRILRGVSKEFPPTRVYDHLLRADPNSLYMQKYREYVEQGLVEPKMKARVFEEKFNLDTNLFKNQRIMATRIYQKPLLSPDLPEHKKKRIRTDSGKDLVFQVRPSLTKENKQGGKIFLRKPNLSKKIGHEQDLLEGGIFSPKIGFLMGTVRPVNGQEEVRLAGPDRKTIVYAYFEENVDLITACFKKGLFGYPLGSRPLVFKITGSTPLSKRQAVVERFNQSEGNIILVISTAAATGLDLKGVSDIVFFDQVWTHSLYLQIVGRGVRYLSHIGIPDPLVRIHNLILSTDPTLQIEFVDDFLYQFVKKKRAMTERFDQVLYSLCNNRLPYGEYGLLENDPSGALRRSQSFAGPGNEEVHRIEYIPS